MHNQENNFERDAGSFPPHHPSPCGDKLPTSSPRSERFGRNDRVFADYTNSVSTQGLGVLRGVELPPEFFTEIFCLTAHTLQIVEVLGRYLLEHRAEMSHRHRR